MAAAADITVEVEVVAVLHQQDIYFPEGKIPFFYPPYLSPQWQKWN